MQTNKHGFVNANEEFVIFKIADENFNIFFICECNMK